MRTHAHRLTVVELEAQTAEVAWQLAEALGIAAKLATEEVVEDEESPVIAEEYRTDVAAIDVDVTTGVAVEERLAATSGLMEEPTTSEVDSVVAKS